MAAEGAVARVLLRALAAGTPVVRALGAGVAAVATGATGAGVGTGAGAGVRERVSTWMSAVVVTGTDVDAMLSALRPARADGVARVGIATGSMVPVAVAVAVAAEMAGACRLVMASKASGASSAARRLGAGGKGMVRGPQSEK